MKTHSISLTINRAQKLNYDSLIKINYVYLLLASITRHVFKTEGRLITYIS